MKTCVSCGEKKPLGEFYSDDRGHVGVCSICCPNSKHQFRKRDLPCFECGCFVPLEQYNQETLGSYGLCVNCSDKFASDNQQAILDLMKMRKDWQKKYPELIRMYQQKSRHNRTAKAKGLAATLTTHNWDWLCKQTGHRCIYCGEKPNALDQEHVIPVSRGGEYTIQNIRPACRSCNSKKWAKTPEEAGMEVIAEYEDRIQAGLSYRQGKLF